MKKIEMTRNFQYGVNAIEAKDFVVRKYDSISSAFSYVYKKYQEGETKTYLVWLVSGEYKMPIVKCELVDGKMVETLIPAGTDPFVDSSTLVEVFKEEEPTVEIPDEFDFKSLFHKNTLRSLDKLIEDIKAFGEETGEGENVELYEDVNTSFSVKNIRIEENYLVYDWSTFTDDWAEQRDKIADQYKDTKEWYAIEGMDSLSEAIKFWRACLNRAKRYWKMSPEDLDKLSEGGEDEDDE